MNTPSRIISHQDQTFHLRERLEQTSLERNAFRQAFFFVLLGIVLFGAGCWTYALTHSLWHFGAGLAAFIFWLLVSLGVAVMPQIHAANRRAEEASEDEAA
ncbi:MAG TPA: hypothetical protein VGE39_00745 [Prosthecobacter sp.]